jgi:hypothetical protein
MTARCEICDVEIIYVPLDDEHKRTYEQNFDEPWDDNDETIMLCRDCYYLAVSQYREERGHYGNC